MTIFFNPINNFITVLDAFNHTKLLKSYIRFEWFYKHADKIAHRSLSDIETTGLTPSSCDITVIGIHLCRGDDICFKQLVGKDITAEGILTALEGIEVLYTYNGSRFDLPFINSALGINLEEHFTHHDLMYDCWRNGLYGGLKGVERRLGIAGSSGHERLEAVRCGGST
jgi:uncharacterized protein YprB with RNaseH-like and TPR domain